MAEYVHKNLEEMLPELEEMTRRELFTPKETKTILKKREAFEYRLQQKTKTKASYLNYIKYEQKLLELLTLRRQRCGRKFDLKGIERTIVDRIHALFRSLNTSFKEDLSLWEKHIEFSMSGNEKAYVSRLYDQVLKTHSHRADIWVKASQWERSQEGNFNAEMAREILLRGQRINPESEVIFLEMYHMELELAQQILKRKSLLGIQTKAGKSQEDSAEPEAASDVGELKLAQIVYKKGLELFPKNPGFHMKMLGICSKFPVAKTQLESMDADLRKAYPTSPQVWNGLALRHLTNYANMSGGKQEAIRKCLAVFKEGIENVPTEAMWSRCLQGHLNILSLRSKDDVAIFGQTLDLFERAITLGTLSEQLFGRLVGLLSDLGMSEDADRVSDLGVQRYPGSIQLWQERLVCLVQAGSPKEDLQKALNTAVKHVPAKESWGLWQFLLNYYSIDGGEILENLMEGACRALAPEVCIPAKVWSLHWTFRQGGINKARAVYNSLKTMRPISLDFYRLYIHIESSQMEPNITLMRGAFEEALAECGKTETDLWLNYMEFETEMAKDAPKAGSVQQRALRALEPNRKEKFIRKHTVMGLGI